MDIPHNRSGSFVVQAGTPATVVAERDENDSLCEAIEKCFVMWTESMVLEWNRVCVPVGYKYDLSSMAEDIALMIGAITAVPAGEWRNGWPSSTFSAEWTVRWDAEWLSVRAHWEAVAGSVVDLLNASPDLVMRKDAFLAEWRRPLEIIVAALRRSGYDERNLPAMSVLVAAIAAVPSAGVLYSDPR